MGADLYIVKDSSEETGYFRDSYNVTNILWKLGLSYWQLHKEIPIGKINRTMSYWQVCVLKAEVEKRKPVLDEFLAKLDEKWLKDNNAAVDEKETVESWRVFWQEKYAKLTTFLNHAIELKSGIRWSV